MKAELTNKRIKENFLSCFLTFSPFFHSFSLPFLINNKIFSRRREQFVFDHDFPFSNVWPIKTLFCSTLKMKKNSQYNEKHSVFWLPRNEGIMSRNHDKRHLERHAHHSRDTLIFGVCVCVCVCVRLSLSFSLSLFLMKDAGMRHTEAAFAAFLSS